MKKTYTIIDEARGLARITTDDERFYIREVEVDGVKQHEYRPSVTWIANYVPKGIGFYKWLAEHGWDESEAIKQERGKYGSRVHKSIEMLLSGEEVRMDTQIPDPETMELKALSVEEYTALISFKDWWVEFNAEHTSVEVIQIEHTLWPENEVFAGSIDLLVLVDNEYYFLIDFKTSQYVYLSHEVQLSAYKRGMNLDKEVRIAVLQVGYRKTKKGYKFTEIEEKYELFQSAYSFWKDEHDGTKPYQKDLPLSLRLTNNESIERTYEAG
jgi:hypothetical protein